MHLFLFMPEISCQLIHYHINFVFVYLQISAARFWNRRSYWEPVPGRVKQALLHAFMMGFLHRFFPAHFPAEVIREV